MNVPLALLSVVGLITLGVVADRYERRADRRARAQREREDKRRLLDEIRRHA